MEDLPVNALRLKRYKKTSHRRRQAVLAGSVELAGIEPASKHILQKLSTCLFPYCLSAYNRKRTNQLYT